MLKSGVFLSIQTGLIGALALISRFKAPDLSVASWDIILFLTPSGILQNYLNREESAIWSFYGDPSPGQVELTDLQLALMVFVHILMILNVYKLLKNRSKSR